MTRYPGVRTGTGETSCTCRVRRSQRVIFPPYTMSGSRGSRAAEGGERPASVGRFPGDDTGGVDHVRIGRVHLHLGEVVGPFGDAAIVADPRPALSRVIGAIEKALLFHLHRGEEARGPGRRDADPDPPEPVVLEVRQAFHQL